MGYHLDFIPKGVYGEISKIEEELLELKDAVKQGVKILAEVELSDLVGAIQGYIEKNHPNLTFTDFLRMAEVTRRAFLDGTRHDKL